MHCVFLADLFFAESWGEPPDGMGSGIMPICSLLLPRRNGMHLTMDASEFADGEALTKFFRKSYSVNGNVGCMSPIFCNFTMKI